MDFNDKVDEFRKWISKLDDDDFSDVMSEVRRQCRIRGNLARSGPLYSCAMLMTIDLNKLNDTNPGVTSDLIGFARSWPTTLSAHKGTRHEEKLRLNRICRALQINLCDLSKPALEVFFAEELEDDRPSTNDLFFRLPACIRIAETAPDAFC